MKREKRRWQTWELDYLIANNDTVPTWKMAKRLKRTANAILCKCKQLDLKRSRSFERDPEKLAKIPKRVYVPSPRQLKPGLHKYGSVKNPRRNYWWIKLEGVKKPIQYHRYIWMQAGREIPPGHKLRFIDGNIDNVTLENLELVTSPAAAPEVKEAIYKARWGNKERVTQQHKAELTKKHNKQRGKVRKAAKMLNKEVKELSFVDRVLMGVI